ncbi:hypothetical protein KSP39_PZI009548 [Platanthera zijinensis]|uniref:Uncharacterized protein n=1 Tax=Platanthera zijinensis TaxID=2320716 RepID=A0AAP0BLC8_9ASPA
MCLPLTLNLARMGSWRKHFSILPNVEIVILSPLERIQRPPLGHFAITQGCLKVEEVVTVFQFCFVPMTRFSLIELTRIMGTLCLFREHGCWMSVRLFREWCEVCLSSSDRVKVRSNKRW